MFFIPFIDSYFESLYPNSFKVAAIASYVRPFWRNLTISELSNSNLSLPPAF